MSDLYEIIYAPEAYDDLRNIYAYIAYDLQVPDIAKEQVNRIRNEIRSLDQMPSRFAFVDWEPWKSRNTHKVPVDQYVVIYIINNESKTVNIVRIFYSGQDIVSILESNA